MESRLYFRAFVALLLVICSLTWVHQLQQSTDLDATSVHSAMESPFSGGEVDSLPAEIIPSSPHLSPVDITGSGERVYLNPHLAVSLKPPRA